jgi:hypothetical protein
VSGHPDLDGLLDPRVPLPEPARTESLRHVSTCAACRARLAAEDPSRLFSLLALGAPPPAVLERLSRGVGEAVAAPAESDRRRRVAAVLAASLAAAALLGGVLWRQSPGGTEVARSAASPPGPAIPATVEADASAAAHVIDLSIGDTQLIMIFDEGLDL